MSKEIEFAQELIDFIYDSPTAFHAVESVEEILKHKGFIEVKEEEKWNLEKGGKYYTTKNNSALIAFVVGKGEVEDYGFKIIGAHTDSPSFMVKPNPIMSSEGGYIKLNTEVYGGPILNTWLDRPLSLAGRVVLKSSNQFKPVVKMVNIKRPILIIPNLAIHMNRDVNNGVALNKQKDMLPVLSLINEELEKDALLVNAVAQELGVNKEEILDFELFLYEYEKGCIMGLNNEFISCGRLDDLSMVHAGIIALTRTEVGKATNVMVCFDNEEVGSASKQGAHSPLLSNTLERIALAMKKDREEYLRALAQSFIISADLAHAVHPNSVEKADPTNKPMLNKGPVIKINCGQKYTTDSITGAVYEQICEEAKVPVQKFTNRSDMVGGSTIGPINSTHINIASVDMGSPILGMHSVRELAGVLDHTYTTKSFEMFYSLDNR